MDLPWAHWSLKPLEVGPGCISDFLFETHLDRLYLAPSPYKESQCLISGCQVIKSLLQRSSLPIHISLSLLPPKIELMPTKVFCLFLEDISLLPPALFFRSCLFQSDIFMKTITLVVFVGSDEC